jgi:hypothetical protein
MISIQSINDSKPDSNQYLNKEINEIKENLNLEQE